MRCFTLILTVVVTALNTVAVPMHSHSHSESSPSSSDAGNAYSGAAGISPGGSVNQEPGYDGFPGAIINAFSDNAGSGGDAASGDAVGGDAGDGHSRWLKGSGSKKAGDAYTGVGGQAPGGSVNNAQGGLINIFSNNAGDGGDASSGSSKGGDV